MIQNDWTSADTFGTSYAHCSSFNNLVLTEKINMLEVFFVTGVSVVWNSVSIMTVFILQHYVFQHFLERELSQFSMYPFVCG